MNIQDYNLDDDDRGGHNDELFLVTATGLEPQPLSS